MKKILLLIFALASASAYSQQEPLYSQYMFNQVVLNPAYAGTHEFFQATLSYRNQWTGLDGAPRTSVFAVEGPVQNERMGVGIVIGNDRIGVSSHSNIHANYSYKIPAGKNTLALGLKAGVSHTAATLSNLKVWDLEDQMYMQSRNSNLVPRFGFGSYFYSENYYAGLSIPSLLAFNEGRNASEVLPEARSQKHYYLNAGYIYTLNDQVKLKPSFLVRYVKAAPVQADISLNAMLMNTLWIGMSYRTNAAVIAMAEYQLTRNLRVAYSYDYSTTLVRRYSNGSHEIRLGWDFRKDNEPKMTRFF